MRDPNNTWDFYDVDGDLIINSIDIAHVRSRFNSQPGHPSYGTQYDRSPGPQSWAPGPPDGIINATDIGLVRSSFQHACQGPTCGTECPTATHTSTPTDTPTPTNTPTPTSTSTPCAGPCVTPTTVFAVDAQPDATGYTANPVVNAARTGTIGEAFAVDVAVAWDPSLSWESYEVTLDYTDSMLDGVPSAGSWGTAPSADGDPAAKSGNLYPFTNGNFCTPSSITAGLSGEDDVGTATWGMTCAHLIVGETASAGGTLVRFFFTCETPGTATLQLRTSGTFMLDNAFVPHHDGAASAHIECQVAATPTPTLTPSPTATPSPTPTPEVAQATILASTGGYLETGSDATSSNTTITQVTVPAAAAVEDFVLTITELFSPGAPVGYASLGEQIEIDAEGTVFSAPVALVLTFDASIVGALSAAEVTVFRNDVLILDCDAPPMYPCVSDRTKTAGGDVRITIEATAFSDWTGAVANTDADACTDFEELGETPALGGLRDPTNPHDFFDVNSSLKVDAVDIALVRSRFNVSSGEPSYGSQYDRSPGSQPWAPGPPNGVIDAVDIGLVRAAFMHSCQAAP